MANERAGLAIPDKSEGAQWLYEQGLIGGGPQLIKLPDCERADRYGIFNPASGEIEWRTAEAAPMDVWANSPADLVDILLDTGSVASRVFVSPDGVLAALNINERTEWVSLKLTPTPCYETLRKNWSGTQAGLINILRNECAGCEKTGLLAIARTVRLTQGSDTTMVANHGAASVSAEVQRKALLNGSDLPEFAEFEFNLFDQLAGSQYTRHVRCVFDVDIERKVFSLRPVAAEIRDAEISTVQELAQFLRNGLKEKEIKVFCGSIER